MTPADFIAAALQPLPVQPIIAAGIATVCAVKTALTSQRAYDSGKEGELPTYFGGWPMEHEFTNDEKAIRSDGARERAKARAAYLQMLTTSLLVITALFGLCASVAMPLVDFIAFVGLVIVLKTLHPSRKGWQNKDQNLEARTEYGSVAKLKIGGLGLS